MKKVEHPVFWTSISVGISMLILFGLSIGIAIDAVDGVVIESLSGTEKINIILAMYFLFLGLPFALGVAATLRSRQAIKIATCSIWFAGITLLALMWGWVIVNVPGFPITLDGFLLSAAIFTYLTSPEVFLILTGLLFIVWFAISQKIAGVK